ncbi:hypothetical protein [Evansella clarkii]|uniref:hypothetical protein n=1 Tax=Evansella clarkii TaxID=79879 RepID=UPI0014302678|nr:hypothetical protein [Evansella clarkii]
MKAGFYASPGGISQSFFAVVSGYWLFPLGKRCQKGPSCPNIEKYIKKGKAGSPRMPEPQKTREYREHKALHPFPTTQKKWLAAFLSSFCKKINNILISCIPLVSFRLLEVLI